MGDGEVRAWLLESDPSIRYQALRDLYDAPAHEVAAERARIAVEGWGAELLSTQTADGYWGGDGPGDRWRYALYTLHLLYQLGIDPSAPSVVAAIEQTRDGVTWGAEFGDTGFLEGEVEPCINGRVLAIGAYFGQGSTGLRDTPPGTATPPTTGRRVAGERSTCSSAGCTGRCRRER